LEIALALVCCSFWHNLKDWGPNSWEEPNWAWVWNIYSLGGFPRGVNAPHLMALTLAGRASSMAAAIL
jgi:hypothetical protein